MRRPRARSVRSVEDPALEARVARRLPMVYAAGADPAHDRPAHVRAASGLVWVQHRLAVIQDDASFIALVTPATGRAEAIPFPVAAGGARQFDDARGNKRSKLDLEAITTVSSATGVTLVAFGSGSLAPREVIVLVSFADGAPVEIDVRNASRLYALLRAAEAFAGSDMNVEGAVHAGEALTLFGRGNGAAVGGIRPVNASCDIEWRALARHLEANSAAPTPTRITQYDLGHLDSVPLGFTDVTRAPGDSMLYSAAAEASPDATRDGEVRGSALGVIDPRSGQARWARVRDEGGGPLIAKVEGVTLDTGSSDRVFAVVDADDHTLPSQLLEIGLGGPWWSAGY